VLFASSRGKEAIGLCPFTGKRDKFYVNIDNGLWDSKTAGMGGNVHQFLEQIQKIYQEAMTPERLKALADHRKLPMRAFEDWDLGWDGDYERKIDGVTVRGAYTLPVYDTSGTMIDIRRYNLSAKSMMSTAGMKVGLMGAHKLTAKPSAPVYICEGEWDCIALTWLLERLEIDAVVLGLPGAGVMKSEWSGWLTGRIIHLLYDNDRAGRVGELSAWEKLKTVSRHITFTHWPADDVPDGFDVRDWVVYGAVEKKTPKMCWERLQGLFRKEPRDLNATLIDEKVTKKLRLVKRKPTEAETKKAGWKPTLEEVHATFSKWLHLRNTDAIDVMLATVLSQRIGGNDPCWVFLVGPPGSAKTAILNSISDYEMVYATSSLTPHSLISGAKVDGVDPSLIPRLNGRVLMVKDFTSILCMREMDKEEIFGYLRDAYDGRCGKVFGNGVERSYVSRFTIVAAVTPRIYDLGENHQALGERFLKFTVGDNLNHDQENDIIDRAIANIGTSDAMNVELRAVVEAFLTNTIAQEVTVIPHIEHEMAVRIRELGKFGAKMRGTVSRHHYHNDVMTARPSAEIGSRLGIQLAKLAQSVALLHQRATVSDDDYRIIKKVALDTISQRIEDVVRYMLKACPNPDHFISTKEVANITNYPLATCTRILDDLLALKVVARKGSGYRYAWSVTPYIRNAVRISGIYDAAEQRNREVGTWFTLRRKRKPRRQTAEPVTP
jgi:MoxR-like ATPase